MAASTSPTATLAADAPTLLQRWIRTLDRASVEAVALVAGTGVAAVAGLVYLTGGTRDVYLHAMYLPVLLLGFRAGPWAGFATGLAGGIAIGPWMPLDVATGEPQQLTSWALRAAFLAAVGAVVGALARDLRARLDRVEALRRLASEHYGTGLRTLAGIVSRRDDLGEGHPERVGHNAAAIGRRLGLGPAAVGRLYWAGLLHGLGRVDGAGGPGDAGAEAAAPAATGALAPEERAAVRAHARAGGDLLAAMAGLDPRPADPSAAPLGERVLAIAETFESLVGVRPYRPALTPEEARRIVVGNAGRRYDLRVVEAFEAALAAGELASEGTPPVPDEAWRTLADVG